MSVHFLILRKVIGLVLYVLRLFASPVPCARVQGVGGGPEYLGKYLGKKHPILLCYPGCSFSIWLLPSAPEMVTIQRLPAGICLRRSLRTRGILRMLNGNRLLSNFKGQVCFCCKWATSHWAQWSWPCVRGETGLGFRKCLHTLKMLRWNIAVSNPENT